MKKKYAELNKKETENFAAIANVVGEYENESHNLENFDEDKNFDIDLPSKAENKIIS